MEYNMTAKNMLEQPSASRLTSLCCLAALVLTLLQGCATVSPVAPKLPSAAITKLPAGFFLPPGFFNRLGAQADTGTAQKEPLFSAPMVLPIGLPTALDAQVSVYASPSTAAYFASGGLDAKVNVRTWEDFLKKYKIPYRVVTSVEQLEKLQPSVLLMPSAVALSEREKLAVIGFRAKGGSVLASWLTGVRNGKGEWRGFDFMHQALDATVVGTTELEKKTTRSLFRTATTLSATVCLLDFGYGWSGSMSGIRFVSWVETQRPTSWIGDTRLIFKNLVCLPLKPPAPALPYTVTINT